MDSEALDKAKDVVDYIAFIVNEFSLKNGLSMQQSFKYLYRYGGVEFLDKHYEVEHCENPILTVETLQRICKRNGGEL
ncbi:MAG: DUF3791 domain-containing protein [Tannerellaceae bacterium]|jgi:hypothetical protein|nr:DUF3791 domain-containing protein [Tannerellaceae bacterium]